MTAVNRGSLSTRQATFCSLSDIAVMSPVGGAPTAIDKSRCAQPSWESRRPQRGRGRGLTINIPMTSGLCGSCYLIYALSAVNQIAVIVLNEHNAVFASKQSAICNRCSPGPTRFLDANGMLISSAVFAGLTRWQTDWQTTLVGR